MGLQRHAEDVHLALQTLSPALDGKILEALLVTGKAALLALRTVEVHVAVAFPALGWRPQLPQHVRLGRFGDGQVSEGIGHAIDEF